MEKKIVLFRLVCCALILAIVAAAAVSCARDEGGTADITDDGGGAYTPAVADDTEDVGVRFQFPDDADFGGQTMRLLTQDRSDWAWSEMTTEEQTGDPINDAIFRSIARVEEGLNIIITENHASDSAGLARRTIAANTDDFDVIFTDSSQAGIIASQGMYLNLHNVPGLDLENPWWNQNANQSAELLGRLFFTTSDANLVTNDAIWVVYFNQVMLQDHGMACPYEMVRNGTWTIDVFYEMARAATRDMDGSGIWTADDQWGISTHTLGFLAFFICQGQQMIRLDEFGEPYVVAPDARFVSAFQKAARLMDQQNGLFLYAQSNFPGRNPDIDHASKTFMRNMSLFCTEVLAWARAFREMTADFGLLPHPKYDVHQEQYLTLMIDTVPAFGIPVTVQDPERVGIFMEALTAIAHEEIMPAYYDVSLHGKFTRDEESMEMLDIIRDGRVFDLAILYNWGGYHSALQADGVSANPNPVVVYERMADRARVAIERTMDMFRELD